MKKEVLFTFVLGCFYMLPHVMYSQSYEFATAYIGNMETTGSIIRRVDNTTAVVYYRDNSFGHGIVALIDLSGNVKKTALSPDCTLNDMRVTGSDVYFCGKGSQGAFIGHINLNDYAVTGLRTATFYTVDPRYVTSLSRMVAYTYENMQKVVAVGELRFTNNSFPLHCHYCDTYPPYDCSNACYRTVIVEANFDHENFLIIDDYVTTNNDNHFEFISEVIETENYVALVGGFTDNPATVVHRCNKGGVIQSFRDDPFYWYSTPLEGYSYYRGCLTRGDTIAVASLSSYYDLSGMEQFSTSIRLFDLTNMTNTQAQRLPLNTKTDPIEMTYFAGMGRLVMLEDIFHPAMSSVENTFVHLEPYSSVDYMADSWFESYWNKTFASLCWLSNSHYVASGGQYWCRKALTPVAGTDCYKKQKISVTVLATMPSNVMDYHLYEPVSGLVAPV